MAKRHDISLICKKHHKLYAFDKIVKQLPKQTIFDKNVSFRHG